MRILIVMGHTELCNMGDVAMLQVAIARLKKLWPGAFIEVITGRPDLLKVYCPDTHPVHVGGLNNWFSDGNLFGFLKHITPTTIYKLLLKLETHIRDHWPSLLHGLVALKAKLPGATNIGDMSDFWKALSKADLVVHSGGGIINDTSKAFETLSNTILALFAAAARSGKPTAMVGQGIGPFLHSDVISKAKVVFPSIGLTAVRESRVSLPLLQGLNVPESRVMITGDDAVEMAHQCRQEQLDNGIGVSLRLAPYSEVGEKHVAELRQGLQDAARKYAAPLIPVPICFCPRESDVAAIGQIIAGANQSLDEAKKLNRPEKIVKQVGHCRLVVAGSYHAAVFALSQGIPAIGLVKSNYYSHKFLGLADQFGAGCEVIFFDDGHFRDKLAAAIDRAWGSAEELRPLLLSAAKRQIETSQAAYKKVYELVTAQRKAA